MRIFRFKKSTEVIANWPFWIIYSLAAGIVAIIIVSLANASVEEAARIPQGLEDLVLASRFYNSEGCFAYKDDVGRVHAKVIDISKFTQENMDKCFPSSDTKHAFSLSLFKFLPEGIPSPPEPIGPINTFNWGKGDFETKRINEHVLVFSGGSINKGNLMIEIKNVE